MVLQPDEYAPGPRLPLLPATARQQALDTGARAAILVEGWSDQAAVDTLARRHDWDLAAERILTLPIGGVTNLGAFVHVLGSSGLNLGLVGLYDAGEEDRVRRSLERAGMPARLSRNGLEQIGFFACDADLEDELLRAVGSTTAQTVLEAQGELQSFRRFQDQPAQRDRSLHAQLRRFMGTRARRKVRYAALLTNAVDLASMPRALDLSIARARGLARSEA